MESLKKVNTLANGYQPIENTDEEQKKLLIIEDKLSNNESLSKEEKIFKRQIYERNKAHALKAFENVVKSPVGMCTTIGFNKSIKDRLK